MESVLWRKVGAKGEVYIKGGARCTALSYSSTVVHLAPLKNTNRIECTIDMRGVYSFKWSSFGFQFLFHLDALFYKDKSLCLLSCTINKLAPVAPAT